MYVFGFRWPEWKQLKKTGRLKMTKNRSSFAFPFIESFDNSHLYFRVRSVRENDYKLAG